MDTLSNLEAEIRDLKELLTLELLPKVSEICTRKQILIYSLHHPQLKLEEPLPVFLEFDDEQTIAYCHDLEVLGYGSSICNTTFSVIIEIWASFKNLNTLLKLE